MILNQKSTNLQKTPYKSFPTIEPHLLSYFMQQLQKKNVSEK